MSIILKFLGPNNVIDFIKYPKRIFPIGRLDKLSEGLIFLTNDGDIVNKILRARNNHEKEYIVKVNRPINSDFIQSMSNGVEILDTTTKDCFVKQLGSKKFKIILTRFNDLTLYSKDSHILLIWRLSP